MIDFIKKIFKSKTVEAIVEDEEPVFDPFKIIEEYTDNCGITFKLGDIVLARGNEPEPLLKGEIIAFDYVGSNPGRFSSPVPIIKINEEKTIMCMGIMKLYTYELFDFLSKMTPMEQWNYLVREYGQLSEKVSKDIKNIKTFTKIDIDNKKRDNINGSILIFNQYLSSVKVGTRLFYCCDCQIYEVIEILENHTIIIDRELSVTPRNPYFNVM